MTKKSTLFTAAALGAAGAGAALALTRQHKQNSQAAPAGGYRNTERGKQHPNRKGIYYSSGNYEAFARPEKPAGVEEKNAWIVGSGLASLAAACFLVRDGQMPGDHIHILEAMDVAGGACDGILDPTRGYVMRGGREMENHFECLWDLFRSIPSLEKPGASVLDEFYWLNKHDPNYSLCRATVHQGEDAHTDGKFNLSRKAVMEIVKLFLTPDEDLYDKTIEDVFDEEVFGSTFWLYWRTMFAFENWHSALEMKLYFQRFIHHIAGLPDFSALKFTRYNQYESLILPMQKYLEEAGVDFRFGTEVTNVLFEHRGGQKIATAIECRVHGKEQGIPLTEKDLVFVTNGSSAAPRAPSTATRTTPPTGTPKSAPAAAGACGRTSPGRTPPSAAPKSSAPISPAPTGSRPPSPPWTTRSCLISRPSASGTPAAARWSPAALSAARIPAGC